MKLHTCSQLHISHPSPYSAIITGRVLYLTRFFFLFLSSGNIVFFTYFLHLILTKLGQSDQLYLDHYSHKKDGLVSGHYEVTGVKKSNFHQIWGHLGQKIIFTKKSSSPLDYRASGQKVIFSKNAIIRPCYIIWPWNSTYGVTYQFGVTWVKMSFSLKMVKSVIYGHTM